MNTTTTFFAPSASATALSPLAWLAMSEDNQQRALSALSLELAVHGLKPEDAHEDFMVHAGVLQRAVSYREFSFAVDGGIEHNFPRSIGAKVVNEDFHERSHTHSGTAILLAQDCLQNAGPVAVPAVVIVHYAIGLGPDGKPAPGDGTIHVNFFDDFSVAQAYAKKTEANLRLEAAKNLLYKVRALCEDVEDELVALPARFIASTADLLAKQANQARQGLHDGHLSRE